uniref:Plastocyanin-like domain-containing protein n=1 Tax=Heterorhabditis bacteriophora TaxID=37862 RepID=A0A1I7XQW5_HETBA
MANRFKDKVRRLTKYFRLVTCLISNIVLKLTIRELIGTTVICKRIGEMVYWEDWATETTEEAWMKLDDKTMKWMYGYDGNTKCWQPTRTDDGGNVGGAVPISALLINDKGWYNQDDIKTRPWALPVERFKIKQGESVLFRIVNGGVAQELMLHVEGHNMTVVAADGDEVVPQPVNT